MTFEQTRLQNHRRSLKLTQGEMADKLGFSQQAYQKIETGKTQDMRISTLKHICKTLGISADWLLGLSEDK